MKVVTQGLMEDIVISLTVPNPGNLQGTVTVTCVSTPNPTRVEFYVNGILKSTDTTKPFTYSFNTTQVANGNYTLKAIAYKGSKSVSAQMQVTVNNGAAPPPAGQPPANQTAPALSGVLGQGNSMMCSTGTWTNNPTSYRYQWSRCDGAGANCVAISGATNNSYTPTAADVGKTLKCSVTAVNAYGTSAAVLTPASGVIPAPPGDTTLPVWPAGSTLTVGPKTQTSIVINWTPATDNVSVHHYEVYKGSTPSNLVKVTDTALLTYTFTGLVANTSYAFGVRAVDAAGNKTVLADHVLSSVSTLTDWEVIAAEYENFTLTETKEVRYGAGGTYSASKILGAGTHYCGNPTFGDPLPGDYKWCEARATTGTPPPPPPPPSGALLANPPPSLVNPITVTAFSGSVINMDSTTRDYIIDISTLDLSGGDVIIYGPKPGRSAVWIGCTINKSAYGDDNSLIIQDLGGRLFLEGIDMPGSWHTDCIAIRMGNAALDTTGAILDIQNCRLRATVPPGHTFGESHPDCLQIQAGYGGTPYWRGHIRFDKCTLSSCTYTQMYGVAYPSGKIPKVTFSRVNTRPNVGGDGTTFSGAFGQFWRSCAEIHGEIWVDINAPGKTAVEQCVHPSISTGRLNPPDGDGAGLDRPVRRQDATSAYCDWSASPQSNLFCKLREGVPAGGDFCAQGVPGSSYTTPGYQS